MKGERPYAWRLARIFGGWIRPRRLRELEGRYRAFGGPAVEDPVWAPAFVSGIDLERFRADGPYVWQKALPNLDDDALRLTFEHARSSPAASLLDLLDEDGRFGAHTIDVSGKLVSRDLLDSLFELFFLRRLTQIAAGAEFQVLDIGAGYGRLAHRAATAFPHARWFSTDAIAVSTYLAEGYLAHRGLAGRAPVIPLDEVEATLRNERFGLAVNVHSFSECRPAAIEWWVERLAAAAIPRLFIVPNAVSGDGREPLTNAGESMSPILARHGYRLDVVEPKFADPEIQRRGVSPTGYFLYVLPG